MIHFTDWFPTILALAGTEAPRDLKLDGIDVMPAIRGERGIVPTRRFWQWNRYTPERECNAAMRDGQWKLVRPAIAELMAVSSGDLAMDIQSKYNPENFHDIVRAPDPDRIKPAPPPAQLFDIVSDPGERNDLAATEPDRVSRMTNELSAWFEEVEQERRTIRD
jgi:arylsulfatase A